jgi:hypothetical protein
MAFYQYQQNNSGGSFIRKFGHSVYVEAASAAYADNRAEAVGIYFDGCSDGRDCPCCGDRWSRAWGEPDAKDFPELRAAIESELDYARGWGLGIGVLLAGASDIVLVSGTADPLMLTAPE